MAEEKVYLMIFDKVGISYGAVNALEDKFGTFDLVNGEDKCYFDEAGQEILNRERIEIEDYYDWDYIGVSKYYIIDKKGYDALKGTEAVVYHNSFLDMYLLAILKDEGGEAVSPNNIPAKTEEENEMYKKGYDVGYDAGYDDGYSAAIDLVMEKLTEYYIIDKRGYDALKGTEKRGTKDGKQG